MLLRYTECEFAEIQAAARDAGLTPSGYAADAALAMATGAKPPSTAPWRSALLELMDARRQRGVRRCEESSDPRRGPAEQLPKIVRSRVRAFIGTPTSGIRMHVRDMSVVFCAQRPDGVEDAQRKGLGEAVGYRHEGRVPDRPVHVLDDCGNVALRR